MDAVVSVVSVGIILGAPLLHNQGNSFMWVGNGLVRMALILYVVYATRQGALPGLLSFLAAFTLLVERNHEVLVSLPYQKPRWPKNSFGPPVQAPPLVGETETAHYEPPHYEHEAKEIAETQGETTITKEFESADDIQDNNPRLSGPPSNQDAPSFFSQKGVL